MNCHAIVPAAAALVFLTSLGASAQPRVGLKLHGFFVVRSSEGSVRLEALSQREARQGERIRWDIVATNSGDQPARDVIAAGRIAPSTSFVPDSAIAGGATTEYSIDGGKTWSSAPAIIVRSASGSKTVPADPSRFTNIRWVGAHALAPGASRRYVYDVVVK